MGFTAGQKLLASQLENFSPGGDITVGDDLVVVGNIAVAGLGGDRHAVKTSDKTVISSTTLSNDTQLVVPVVASATYALYGYFIYSSSTTADAKFAITGPASATAQLSGYGVPTTEAGVFGTMNISVLGFGSDWQIGGAGVGTKRTCIPHGTAVIAGTAGNLTVQFAQVTSDATNSVLHTGSWLIVKRIG